MTTPDEPLPDTEPPLPGRGLMALLDHGDRLIELVAGYKRKAIAAGFTHTTAERMAEQLHNELLPQHFRINHKPPPTPQHHQTT